jgi:uncharacterized protein
MSAPKQLEFAASKSSGKVSALLTLPSQSRALYVLAHGAGAGMNHSFLDAIARGLETRRIGTFRYQFPYMEAGRNRVDPPAIAAATVRSAVAAAAQAAPGVPLYAGGKSFGGRMTSTAQSQEPMAGVNGLIFLGFPLHAAGKPDDSRAAHLTGIRIPMLFLQGTRDALADLALLGPICKNLGRSVTLHELDGADHSFHVLRKSGRTDTEVMDESLDAIESFVTR